jgi:hypothetical protein
MLIEKEQKMTEFEKQCYGITEADIRTHYMEGLAARHAGLEMVVMSILSDCQELQSFGLGGKTATDQVRKNLNIAKYILSEMLETKSTKDSDYLDSDAHLSQVE